MTTQAEWLADEMAVLVEVTERARTVLKRYERASTQVVRRVHEGQRLVDALDKLDGAARRREVTDAMGELSAARHRVRLAMFALGESQGTRVSELGRKLGLSRQLASRLAKEAASAFPRTR